MIKNGSGGANTQTGTKYEKLVSAPIKKNNDIDLSKHNLYNFLKKNNINWNNIISKKLLPDEAYYNPVTKEFRIYEKNFSKLLVQLMKNHKLADLKLDSLKS